MELILSLLLIGLTTHRLQTTNGEALGRPQAKQTA